MAGDETLAAEFRRLLAELEARVGDRINGVSRKADEVRSDADRIYVKKETYEAHRTGDDRRFKELERDNENQAGFRRQVMAGLILMFIGVVVTAILTINGLQK